MSNKEYITALANNIVKKAGTRNPYEIAKYLNIEVLFIDFKKQKGVYKIIKKNRFIFLNSGLDEVTKKIVMFHEIGHDLLHRRIAAEIGAFQEFNLFNNSQMEYEANLFAAEVSLPTNEFMKFVELNYTSEQIASILRSDVNLIALKAEILCSQGYTINRQDYCRSFLRH